MINIHKKCREHPEFVEVKSVHRPNPDCIMVCVSTEDRYCNVMTGSSCILEKQQMFPMVIFRRYLEDLDDEQDHRHVELVIDTGDFKVDYVDYIPLKDEYYILLHRNIYRSAPIEFEVVESEAV